MFGFVVINEADLSDAEKERYQQVYCGVCRALHSQYGQRARLALNHDMCFMALMLMSLYEPDEDTGQANCLVHPIEKRPFTSNVYVDYAAAMTVILAYYKSLDNWSDDRSHASWLYAQSIESAYRQVQSEYPRQCEAVERELAAIDAIQDDDSGDEGNPDKAAHHFGLALAEFLVKDEDLWSVQLRTFGYHLGRFIYMMDAAVDQEEDEKKGSYNPFASRKFNEEELRMLLSDYMAQACDVFERLPLVQDDHVLRSVIYAGVWQRFNALFAKNEAQADQQKASS